MMGQLHVEVLTRTCGLLMTYLVTDDTSTAKAADTKTLLVSKNASFSFQIPPRPRQCLMASSVPISVSLSIVAILRLRSTFTSSMADVKSLP